MRTNFPFLPLSPFPPLKLPILVAFRKVMSDAKQSPISSTLESAPKGPSNWGARRIVPENLAAHAQLVFRAASVILDRMAHRKATSQNNGVMSHPYWLLRRADQAAVATLLLLSLGSMILWWAGQGGLSGRRIELQRVEPLAYQFQVDLNLAPWQELVLLPGVGETLAMRIIESREADGPFVEPADLLRVHGIGPATLDRLLPYLVSLTEAGHLAGDPTGAPPGDG